MCSSEHLLNGGWNKASPALHVYHVSRAHSSGGRVTLCEFQYFLSILSIAQSVVVAADQYEAYDNSYKRPKLITQYSLVKGELS